MLIQRFREYVHVNNLFTKADRLLIAVSGGVDSVVLCDLCHRAGYKFAIAHCNFQLRGEESDKDEAFVRKMAGRYGLKIFVKRFDTEEYAIENRVSIQVAARELRYAWFEELRQDGDHQLTDEENAPAYTFILTAHHADDNIETLLMNFFKGTGIKGLQAILPRKGMIIRPLLFAYKEELTQYALRNELEVREDLSNYSNKYTRNYFRNVLIPGVQEVFPQVKENLTDNIERFREMGWLYEEAIALHKKKLLEIEGTEVKMPILKLRKIKPIKTLLYEIFKDYGFSAASIGDIEKLMESASGHYVSSASHRVVNNRGWLVLTPLAGAQSQMIVISSNEKKVIYPEGVLTFENRLAPVDFTKDARQKAFIDVRQLKFPLILRPWREGDYFYPLGLQKKSGKPGKKKLSGFFTDLKLSIVDKEKVWVLESSGRIVWVVGLRADERFKVKESTGEVLVITKKDPGKR